MRKISLLLLTMMLVIAGSFILAGDAGDQHSILAGLVGNPHSVLEGEVGKPHSILVT